MTGTNGTNGNGAKIGTEKVKQGLAQMLKGGVIVSSFMSYMFCRNKSSGCFCLRDGDGDGCV